MSDKPRALGYIARRNVVRAQQLLAHCDRILEPLLGHERLILMEYELIGAKARADIAETRRILEETLRLGTGPLSQEEP